MADNSKILIVEDDEAIAKLYQIELETKGYKITIAYDGEQALQKISAELPDLVLLDIMMPKLNGIDVLKKLRGDKKTKALKVIMLTNFGQEDLIKQAYALNAHEYILKYQSTPAEVAAKIQQALNKSGWTAEE